MENVSNAVKLESIKSFQSTIGKLEKALTQMTEKGANTTLVEKRYKACSSAWLSWRMYGIRGPILIPGRT